MKRFCAKYGGFCWLTRRPTVSGLFSQIIRNRGSGAKNFVLLVHLTWHCLLPNSKLPFFAFRLIIARLSITIEVSVEDRREHKKKLGSCKDCSFVTAYRSERSWEWSENRGSIQMIRPTGFVLACVFRSLRMRVEAMTYIISFHFI